LARQKVLRRTGGQLPKLLKAVRDQYASAHASRGKIARAGKQGMAWKLPPPAPHRTTLNVLTNLHNIDGHCSGLEIAAVATPCFVMAGIHTRRWYGAPNLK
jgi:hypothetical protein